MPVPFRDQMTYYEKRCFDTYLEVSDRYLILEALARIFELLNDFPDLPGREPTKIIRAALLERRARPETGKGT